MAGLKFVSALVLCLLVVSPIATTAITCGQVSSQVAPCLNYMSNGGPLPPACCDGVRNLKGMARNTSERQTSCRCFVNAIKDADVKGSRTASLPGKCGVTMPYVFSTAVNCDSVK